MHDAVLKMIMPFANVFEIIMEIHMKAVDQNVRAIPIVQWAKHASETNVKIHVLEFAALKQFVRYQIIFQFVHAHQEQRVMHSDNVWLKKDIFKRMQQEIHAIHHHVQWIQFVEIKAMCQYANVYLAISEIQRELDVIQNVWLAQIVHVQNLVWIINVSIHVQMCVVLVQHVKRLITVQSAHVQVKQLVIHLLNVDQLLKNKPIHAHQIHVISMVSVVLSMELPFAHIRNVLQMMIVQPIEVASIKNVAIHVWMHVEWMQFVMQLIINQFVRVHQIMLVRHTFNVAYH